ncbi:protein-disulfide reductase DsbD domain-containing protein [Ahrensia marina]|uniref:protein-disulfide reductase DsbD domain-containing protein n=1 Tax=Ahrensia marina TaxID=1514904 RepID=UPI0035CED130
MSVLCCIAPMAAVANETRTSVALEGATISLSAAPSMAEVLLSDAISLGEGEHVVFLSIDLNEGWKTYWRLPGRFGLAPDFDWQASENVASATVHFPKPSLFQEGEGTSIGYGTATLWPVIIRTENEGQPIDVHLSLNLGLCAELCLPETVELSASMIDLVAEPAVTMAQVFALQESLASGVQPLADVALLHQHTEIALIQDKQSEPGSFAIVEDTLGRHVLLHANDNQAEDTEGLRGEWQWETPITCITVIEPSSPMQVFTNDNCGQTQLP